MRHPSPLAVAFVLLVPALALAADVPLAGRKLSLRAGRQRGARIVHRDAALAAPFPDPTAGAALIVSGGAAPGQCRAEIALDPGKWEPLGDDGPSAAGAPR
jgi:hypothetical protein